MNRAWLWILAGGAVVALLIAIPLLRTDRIDVTVTQIERGAVEQTITNVQSGAVIPRDSVHVSVMIMGVIESVHVTPGMRVKKGDVLLELDRSELDARVQLAEATLQAARSQLKQLRANENADDTSTETSAFGEDLAERHLRRVQELMEAPSVMDEDGRYTLPGSLSEMTFGQAYRAEIMAFQVAQLESALELAKIVRERAVVRAPVDGFVALPESRMPAMPAFTVVSGGMNASAELPRPGEAVGMGMPLFRVVDDSEFRVRASFDETSANDVKPGQSAQITFDTHRDRVYQGRVVDIAPVVSINPDMSRTLDIILSLDDADIPLLAGMSADVIIVVDRKEDVLAVPAEALVREEFAYVVDNGVARRRDLTLGTGNWQAREVLDGLEPGEVVITNVTAADLADGIRVRIVDELGAP